jgi:hypothetical protein
MKKIAALILFTLPALFTWSQKSFLIPSPTNPNDSVTIYINVGETTGSLKTMLNDHPEYMDSIYMWTWMPAGPVCGNGEWLESNECMKLTRVTGLFYSIKILPTAFYGVSPTEFFQNGISCLAKIKNGKMFEDAGLGDAKTEDLKIDIVPALCSEVFCYFPETARTDDFLSITYDNTQEENLSLQNLGEDDCYIYMRAKTGTFTFVEYADETEVTNTPALKMNALDATGKFRLTFLPQDFFTIPPGQSIQSILFYIVKPGYLPVPPVYQTYVPLDCD